MPELPEVEIFRRYVERHALGQRVSSIPLVDPRIVGERSPASLEREVRGNAFRSARRHGKHLFLDLGTGTWLHLHFGMTGDLLYYRSDSDQPRFARVIFRFGNGFRLAFEDMRRFGRVDLSPAPESFVREESLGPDPLESGFTLRRFRERLAGRSGAIKSIMMNQTVVAGLGNLYVDETLFQAGVHPGTSAIRLKPAEQERLYLLMRSILREAIRRRSLGRSLPERYLFQNREEGAACPMCGGRIRRTVVFGRTTYFCSRHQRCR